jgi:hypothetical protein
MKDAFRRNTKMPVNYGGIVNVSDNAGRRNAHKDVCRWNLFRGDVRDLIGETAGVLERNG